MSEVCELKKWYYFDPMTHPENIFERSCLGLTNIFPLSHFSKTYEISSDTSLFGMNVVFTKMKLINALFWDNLHILFMRKWVSNRMGVGLKCLWDTCYFRILFYIHEPGHFKEGRKKTFLIPWLPAFWIIWWTFLKEGWSI